MHRSLHEKRIRLIVPDRPGCGRSSPLEHRRFTDYPADIDFLATHLELGQYAILGVSGGGPYALACARYLSPDSVAAIGLLSPAGPWEFDATETNKAEGSPHAKPRPKAKPLRTVSWLGAMAVLYIPTLLELVLKVGIGVARWLVTKRWVIKRIERSYERDSTQTSGKGDDEPLSASDQAYQAISTFEEITRQGTAPIMQEAKLLLQPWDFNVSDILYEGLRIWHGIYDVHAPIDESRWIASQLPNPHMEEYAFDHPEMLALLDVIVDELVTPEMRAKRSANGGDAT